MTEQMTEHTIGTREEWLAAREQLLVREKEHTRLGDEIAQQRRELPWVRVEKEYRFQTDDGEKPLVELFDGRSQLLVYHFMFGPSYEAGCPTCSSMADGIDGLLPHLHARDVTFAFVSQAPLEKLQAYKRRMGWSIPWVSTARTDFNFDLGFSSSEGQTREWVEPMADYAVSRGVPRATARADARLAVAVCRGLLLDLLATGDRQAVDAAFNRYLAHISAISGPFTRNSAANGPKNAKGRAGAGTLRRR